MTATPVSPLPTTGTAPEPGTSPAAAPEPPVPLARLTDPAWHATGDPHALWRWMRAHAPVHWHPPGDLPGFWSLTRYEDVRAVYREPETFSSARGVLLRPASAGDDPGAGLTLALTDAPRHRALRALMADWFSTRAVRRLDGYIRRATTTVVSRALALGRCDVVDDIAGRLSLAVICHVLGIPEEDHEDLFRWTNETFAAHTSLAAHPAIMRYFLELMERRLAEPGDDLVSALVHGTVEGEPLSEEEIVLNCENLVGATENGRLALIGGVQAFLDHPDQWRRLRDRPELLSTAVEEVLRWTSSATHSMRTATRPREIRGRLIEPGDRVVLWLPSANRDEDVFPDPYRFDVARRPNRHIALAAGPHVCIGGNLARAEARVLFTELLARVARFEPDGPVVRQHSLAVNGPARLPVRLVPR